MDIIVEITLQLLLLSQNTLHCHEMCMNIVGHLFQRL